MKTRLDSRWSRAWGLFALVCAAAPLAAAQSAHPRTPNVVILFADDLGWGDLGSYGNPNIRTPNLDRMAAQGQRWTDFYVAAPICSPSRGALLTGRLPVRSGLYGNRLGVYYENEPYGLPAAEVTLAEALRDAGYATAMVGKWHLGDRPSSWPTRHGFDRWLGLPHSNDMEWTIGMTFEELLRASAEGRQADVAADLAKKHAAYFAPRQGLWNVPLLRSTHTSSGDGTERFTDEVVERPAVQATLTRRYTDEAISFLEGQSLADPERPFFLYLAYTMPHVPLFASDQHAGTSLGGLYADVVEEIDDNVGRLVAALERLGQAADTLVVFTSDNGPWLTMNEYAGSAGPLRDGKGTTFEGGMREPALFWWPGTITPAVVHDIGTTMDLFATAVALAGAHLPEGLVIDGLDLSPALFGRGRSPRDELPFYRGGELYAYRRGPYKIHFVTEGAYGQPPVRAEHDPPELYDLREDPGERFDLSARHPEIVAELVAAARALQRGLVIAPPLFDRRLASYARPHGP